ncbi:LOW QUALITY PROTEIN: U2 small nuclear ribonucleoprotein A'-like isoform X2 [Canis lupus familiaris]|uniref:LOW QUALITY PROTEIN: U2 small nuclear ribonucleoprotein A'-like isoform X2 n=1 Tax=Canis lupus familiaris TaxID=9615 RepID=UPI0018F5BB14|nr:LOW QUALITY PROTEIN: U2 small nuclear ribonucleoprotein A'-like isoform X2 [Canis lupus familiaris]
MVLKKLICHYSKIEGCTVNIQKSMDFLYASNDQVEFDIKNNIYITSLKNRILGTGTGSRRQQDGEADGSVHQAVQDRELDLQGYRIPVIENLGATLDQFDAIDFSDNKVRKLDGFPLLRRLKTLLVNNNRMCRTGEGLDQALPRLRELILTNNSLVELGDLDPLASLKSLTYLSILRNPVTNKKHYRLYVIYEVPQVRVLDFQKVKLKEPQEAEKMFKGKRGTQLAKDIARRSKTFSPGAGLPTDKKKGVERCGPSPGDVEAIKNAIANVSTLAEVEQLKGLLQSGPGRERRSGPTDDGEEELEEDTVTNGS